MQPGVKDKLNSDSNAVEPQDVSDDSETLTNRVQSDSAFSEAPEDLVSVNETVQSKQAYFFRNLLLSVSIILVAGTAIFSLDLLAPVMLGCGVIGFNYFWTMQFVRKMLLERKLQALDLLFPLAKFGISVMILFVALQYLELSPWGLLIGLSNLPLAAIIYSFIRVMHPQKSV
ncbi:MAG TPA: hypothetical protein EYO60_05915 [Candidatus Lambdaproteobacteria bacterium]|nr:hypothetical protein [SAR324 cluster bacterium]HIB93821.1 hypothetical protein [Candidatus Lambdaproteobacteria bacterium]HIO82950.1 hypothetical protein [Deltaproteobacteria bacterium]